MVLTKLIDYWNQYPALGLPSSKDEFFGTPYSTYETLIQRGFIDLLQGQKTDISVILRTGGTTSLAYKTLPSSSLRFAVNDNTVSRKLLFDILSYQGFLFPFDVITNGVVFLPGNAFTLGNIPMRYVSNALVSERGQLGSIVCPVPQHIFDGIGFDTVEDKMNAMIGYYQGRSPCVISGVPSVILQFADVRNTTRSDKLAPKILIVGGCAVTPYIDTLRTMFGDQVLIIPYYNATEGTFAYQPRSFWSQNDYETLQLMTDCGIWYEFMDAQGKILGLENVDPGQDYVLLISTYDGLCRYQVGDIIRFTDVEQKLFSIVGRTSEYIDIANEHTQIQHIQQTISQLDIIYSIGQYCVFPSQDDGGVWYYVFVVEYDGSAQEEEIAQKFDEILGTQNYNYAAKRSGGTLGPAQVKFVEKGWFNDLIAQLNHERQSTQSKLLTLYPRDDNPVRKRLKLDGKV